MRAAVITTATGRHDHLRAQRRWLEDSTVRPDLHVVVALGDGGIRAVAAESELPTAVCELESGEALPLAAARNAGARVALQDGVRLLVFLDVDCIPSVRMLARYRRGAQVLPEALLSGPVAYLPEPGLHGYRGADLERATGHPARPVPAEDAIVPRADPRLFWSLSFAVTADTWHRIGGFCESYLGYGAEDTDLAQTAAVAGIDHAWVGGAWAYHQWHESFDPPLDHLADIVRNANLFHDRWGWWPMAGWLDEFRARGLIQLESGRCALTADKDALLDTGGVPRN